MVTTQTAPTDAEAIPRGYWEREASHQPRPLTPLGESVFLDGVNQSFPKVFAEMGLLLEALEFRTIRGYVYTHARPFGVKERQGGALPPKPLLWLLMRTVPALRRRNATCARALRERVDAKMLDRWRDEWRPTLETDIARLRALDLAAMSDDALAQHLTDLRAWINDAFDVHFFLSVSNGYPLARLIFFCRDHLGYDDMRSLALLSGLSSASSEPALALARVADAVRARQDVAAAVLAAPAGSVAGVLQEHDRVLAAAFDAYRDEYGFRALRYEVIEPTLGEQPEVLGRLLQDQLRSPSDVASEQKRLARERDDARDAALAALPGPRERDEFTHLLAEATRANPGREENEFFTVSVPFALARVAALEVGRRLVARGVAASPDDAFFLRFDELVDAVRGVASDSHGLVAARRTAMAEAEAFDPPATYGEPPPEPPLEVLPPAQREAMVASLYLQQRIFGAEDSAQRIEQGAREIAGKAAARGTYTGVARVVMGEHEFDRLQSGDVLVCPITSPVWSVLFSKVGALVTDSGGILSHPAIIAREYGIPAVVATGNGTAVIPDGVRVEVDGSAGTVRILA